ncbi:hypothetical protein L873DRAFT_1887245 [Choiromyces venosus 120613-1]|uniref:Retrotransposon gag domain-containing protein n=1 Tax=Choiromyces venosus 120613-1 TaxID=1336337 RepID=A0A3N4IV15_9PEZI|nr:hypothetical protein L873DRAFT_1887245 [Choiromyces venosus 120613-1]
MGDIKPMKFAGKPGENVGHFLKGFQLYYSAQKGDEDTILDTSELRAYHVIQNLESGSPAALFVHRLPAEITGNYEKLCHALQERFENSREIAEERRIAEASFLSLRQKRRLSLESYIKLTRKIASGMSEEMQHLVATQFVRGLDSRELRIQAMSGLSGRPSVAEAITKVQRVAEVIEGESTDRWNSDESDDSESNESSDESRYGKRKSKKGKKGRKGNQHSTRGIRQGQGELKAEEETGRIRRELEELKDRITKNEQKEYGLAQTGLMGAQNLGAPPMEAFAIGNRLAPPRGYVTDRQGQGRVDHFEPRTYHPPHACWSDQMAPQGQQQISNS